MVAYPVVDALDARLHGGGDGTLTDAVDLGIRQAGSGEAPLLDRRHLDRHAACLVDLFDSRALSGRKGFYHLHTCIYQDQKRDHQDDI